MQAVVVGAALGSGPIERMPDGPVPVCGCERKPMCVCNYRVCTERLAVCACVCSLTSISEL